MTRQIREWVLGLTVAICAAAGSVNAAPITQTLNFSFTNFTAIGTATPTLVTEATGSVSFTYDTATPTSITGQAVDSFSFTSSTPPGFDFLTSNVLFDLRLGGDLLVATNTYEISFYQDEEPVFFNKVGDFLILVGALGPIGADVPGGGLMGSQMLFIDKPGSEGFYQSANGASGSVTSSSVPVTAEIAEPAPLMVLGLGLAGLGLLRRRV